MFCNKHHPLLPPSVSPRAELVDDEGEIKTEREREVSGAEKNLKKKKRKRKKKKLATAALCTPLLPKGQLLLLTSFVCIIPPSSMVERAP